MPQTTCIVPGCTNSGDHILPSDKNKRDAWIHAIRRGRTKFAKWSPSSKYAYICRAQFTEDDYVSITYHGTAAQQWRLKKTATPSVFPWTSCDSEESVERKHRVARRSLLKKFQVTANENINIEAVADDMNVGANEVMEIIDDGLETDGSLEHGEDKQKRKSEATSETQTPQLPMYSIENFRDDDAGIHFYTGLETIGKFFLVLNTLGPAAYCLRYINHSVQNISVADQFFMTLIKLRRHTTNFELSRMFSVSERGVANIIFTWICFMYKQWKELNIWPPKEMVQYFSPSGFKSQYPNTRVIVDGTECPIKKPKNPKSQQATFSTYKYRNTVKVLVGATPGGLISYVSPAYAGSTSDRQIVERSWLITLCDPKDSVMADKGFNVQDLFASQDVTVNIPTFFRRKNRLSGEIVVRDRKIASKRVHIERLIGLAKTYRIMVEPMSASETNLSTEIIFICCMLCNFRNCIVPKNA